MELVLGFVLMRSSSSKHWKRNRSETWKERRSTTDILIWKFVLWATAAKSVDLLEAI